MAKHIHIHVGGKTRDSGEAAKEAIGNILQTLTKIQTDLLLLKKEGIDISGLASKIYSCRESAIRMKDRL